ncbi:MAG: TrkH family potassium uptake protein [Clostridiaceae bacterium]|nr:TrkH family potassium uptake protein [Clostridiaceae bacterium]
MNTRMVLKSLGIVIMTEGLCMVLPLIVSLIYGQGDAMSFVVSILVSVAAGFILYRIPIKNRNFYARDGFAVVALSWIVISLFGSVPFIISGAIPSFIDAFFETVSGFTTTGSTILQEIESLPRGILFWRSFTHWMGGMGVLVLTLAVLPSIGVGSLHIMKAESTGPSTEKLVPKLGQTAKILYTIYTVMTAIQIIFLLIAGMPLYDSIIHAFGSAGTGGFSNRNLSVGSYGNVYIEIIITVFTILFGVNFGLYYRLIKGDRRSLLKDEEFIFYIGTIIVSIALITADLCKNGLFTFGQSLRHSSFQVGTIITTTGYSTTDFNLWPAFSKVILVVLMLFGACAGSTGGGIKCIRILLLFKTVRREIARIIHPRAVHTVKTNHRVNDEETLTGILTYFFIYSAVFVVSTLLISINGKDLITSVTSVIATLSNIGPGLGLVGPMGNFSGFSPFSKLVFCFDMIAGRLEFLPMLVLFSPMAWKKGNM